MNVKNLKLECLYINNHSTSRFIPNITSGCYKANVIKQVGKNGSVMSFYRLIINNDNQNMIINLYESIDKKIYGKMLTILSNNQLWSSKNLNNGKLESIIYNVDICNIEYKEMFFDYNIYYDFLNKENNERINCVFTQ